MILKIGHFPRNVGIFGNMGKKRFLKVISKNNFFSGKKKNDFFKVVLKKRLFPLYADIFGHIFGQKVPFPGIIDIFGYMNKKLLFQSGLK